MKKTTGISIRVDAQLKEQSEKVMGEFGLNMTTTVNMLLHQIVREQSIPLSLSVNPAAKLRDDLVFSQLERMSGYKGLTGGEVAEEMQRIIVEAENAKK